MDLHHPNDEHEYTLLEKQSLRFRLEDFIKDPYYIIDLIDLCLFNLICLIIIIFI